MAKFHTLNPLGSTDPRDLLDNSVNLDDAVNSDKDTWVDRFDVVRRTMSGIDKDANKAMLAYGYVTKKSFALGNTLSNPNEVLYSESDGEYYRWDGALPKVVPAGSTPESAGGMGPGAWHGVGDASLRHDLSTPQGAGYSGYGIQNTYSTGSVGSKLNRIVYVEDFADKNTSSDDWRPALRAALNFAVTNKVRDVHAIDLVFSGPMALDTSNFSNIHLKGRSVTVSSQFPANSTVWDAKSIFDIGSSSGQVASFELDFELIDGQGKADYVKPVGMGFCYGRIRFGRLTNCIRGISNGDHQWPNASVMVEGDSLNGNWIGIELQRGSGGTTPVSEGWNLQVRFAFENKYGAYVLRGGSQYAKLFSHDLDFNGSYLSIAKVSSLSGITRKMSLSNGTTTCGVLAYYSYQGSYYVILMESKEVKGGNSSFSAGQTLTGNGVSTNIISVETTATNASQNNYFDLIHDFEGEPFAKVTLLGGYVGGIRGGNQFSSTLMPNNSYEGNSLNIRGLGVSESGTTLALYRKAESDDSFMDVTSSFISPARKLYMKYRLIEGVGMSAILANSQEFSTIFTLSDQDSDKYLNEGSMYEITVKSNYAPVCGYFLIYVVQGNASVLRSDYTSSIFAFQLSGMNFQVRQSSQASMQFVFNIRRI